MVTSEGYIRLWCWSVWGCVMCEYIHSGLWSSSRGSLASSRLRISDFLFSVIRSEFELGTEKVQLLQATQQAVPGIQLIFSGWYTTWHGGGLKHSHAKECSSGNR